MKNESKLRNKTKNRLKRDGLVYIGSRLREGEVSLSLLLGSYDRASLLQLSYESGNPLSAQLFAERNFLRQLGDGVQVSRLHELDDQGLESLVCDLSLGRLALTLVCGFLLQLSLHSFQLCEDVFRQVTVVDNVCDSVLLSHLSHFFTYFLSEAVPLKPFS